MLAVHHLQSLLLLVHLLVHLVLVLAVLLVPVVALFVLAESKKMSGGPAKLAEEELYQIKVLIDNRFGHSTFQGIVDERKKRIKEYNEAERKRLSDEKAKLAAEKAEIERLKLEAERLKLEKERKKLEQENDKNEFLSILRSLSTKMQK